MDLDQAARTSWIDNGWVHVVGSLDLDDIERLLDAVGDLVAWADSDGPGLHHFEQTDHGPAIARSERFADDHAELGAFVRSGPPAALVAALLDEPAVLFKEKVNYKQPGGAGFAPHRDAAAYRFVDHHVSVMVPLDAATVDSGCLWFAPGHREGAMETEPGGRLTEAAAGRLDWRPLEVEPGDLVAFDSYAPHHSDTNRSAHPRRALYLTYNAARLGDHRARYYADKDAEFAASGATFDDRRVRISISDDFLGRPVT
ncbi:MAG: phytanoyl-CoA dioxygenase family protein [Actinomycetota bacterium]